MSNDSVTDVFKAEIDQIVLKMHHKKGPAEIKRWLNNFEGDDQITALEILRRLVYVGDDELLFEANEIVKKIELHLTATNKAYFYPIAKYGKSATLVSYYFKKSPHFDALEKQGKVAFLSNESQLNTTVLYQDDILVFFDDFFGSGGSFIKSYRQIARKSSIRFEAVQKQFAAAVFIMPSAETLIKSTFPNMQFVGNLHYKLFGDDPLMFASPEMAASNREFASGYAARKSLFRNTAGWHHLGYQDTEALISFPYMPPNNTLPIIWSSKSAWRPLLPRFDDEIYESVKKYKGELLYAAANLNFGLPADFKGLGNIRQDRFIIAGLLSMIKNKTPIPQIAVVIGININDLENYLFQAVRMELLDGQNRIREKGDDLLAEIEKSVRNYNEEKKDKKDIVFKEIRYLPKIVSGK